MWTMENQTSPIVTQILLKIENLIKTLEGMKPAIEERQAHSARTPSRSDQVQPVNETTTTPDSPLLTTPTGQALSESSESIILHSDQPLQLQDDVSSEPNFRASNRVPRVEVPNLFATDFSSILVLNDAEISEESLETKLCVSNTVSDPCPLAVCENDLVDFTSDFVTKMDFVGSLCPTHPFRIVTRCMKPPPKPPDVIKLDETLDLKLSFGASYLFLNLCSPSVCKNALMVWPSHSSIQMDSVGGFNCISNPKIETTFVKPPAKPPDDFFICAPLDVKVWIEIATSYTNVHPKSCDMIFECLSVNMCEFDLKKSGGGSGLEDKNEPVCLNVVLYKGNEKEFAVKKIFLMILMRMKYVILHVLEGVLADKRSDFDLLSLVRLEYLNTWISRLQKVFSVDFSSVFGSLKSEVVIEAMGSRVWSSDQHFPNYLHLCISIVCENAPRISSASSDTRWHFMGYYHILCEWNDVQNIWSWFEKPLWLPTDVTSYILLWHGLFLCTEAENFVKSLDMGCFVIVLKNEEVITHKIQGRQRSPYLCSSGSFVVFLIVSAVVTHYLHLNLIDSANLEQPINMVLSGEVLPKGFTKLLLCNEQAKLEHDIIIIGIDTEGTNPSKFSLIFDTVWVNKQICKFIWKVMLWVRTCLTQDSEAVKVYQERSGLRRYIHGQGCVNFCCCNLTSHSSPIKWVWSLFRLVFDKILDTHYNSVMRCLLDSISFISRGCYIKPLMLNANSTRMVDWHLQMNSKIEFMVTLQRIEKDGQIFGTHKLQFLCFLAHQKAYDFFPSKISNWVPFFASQWTTFFSQILATMNLKLDKMEGTQIYGTNLQQRILFKSSESEKQAEYEEAFISLKFINAASYGVLVAALVVKYGSLGISTTSLVTQRMRDYAWCTSFENHVLQKKIGSNDQQPLLRATKRSIFLSIEMDQFFHAPSYVTKVEPLAAACDPVTFAKLQIVAELTYLETKKRETCIESGNNNSGLVTPQDVASYARWCALASFDWTERKNKVINNSNFKKFLELVSEVRELITNFYSSHYTLCLAYPGDNKSNLLLDSNQSDHVKTLYEQFHEEAVIQCVYHFMFVDMRMHANACRTIIGELKKEIEALITDNQTQARIDSHNQVFFKRNFAWNLLTSISTWRCEFLLFSLPRPPEVDDLEDKVDFKGRGMMRINNGPWAAEGPHSYYHVVSIRSMYRKKQLINQ